MDLRDYLRGLRRHWLAIVLLTLIGTATAYGWTLLQSPVYEATADGLVQSRATAEQGGSVSGDGLARAKVPTYLEMAGWKVVAERAIEELGLSGTAEQVASQVAVVNPAGTSILKVTARAGSPADAAALAQAWITALAATIDEVEEGTSSTVGAEINIYPAPAAAVSSAPVFPDTRTALIVGAILGLGAGVAFALVRTASDRRIRVSDDIEAQVDVPVVGTIPASPSLAGSSPVFDAAGGGAKNGAFAVAEGLRTLRTNLRFMDVDNPPRTIVVTSPLPGDGKSTIACNLAITLAKGGNPVILIDGDLRRPTVATSLGLPGGAGLSDVLTDRARLSEVLQRTAVDPNLLVLAAGTIPPNPSEVLGSGRMRQLIGDLAKHATVIVDAPPLLAVTDGAVLTHQTDGALIVVSVGKTTYDFVEKSIDTLHKANGRALGIVLNKTPLKGVDASPYATAAYAREYARKADAPAAGSPETAPEPAAEAPAAPTSPPSKRSRRGEQPGTSETSETARPEASAEQIPASDVELDESELSFEALRAMAASDDGEGPAKERRPRRAQRS